MANLCPIASLRNFGAALGADQLVALPNFQERTSPLTLTLTLIPYHSLLTHPHHPAPQAVPRPLRLIAEAKSRPNLTAAVGFATGSSVPGGRASGGAKGGAGGGGEKHPQRRRTFLKKNHLARRRLPRFYYGLKTSLAHCSVCRQPLLTVWYLPRIYSCFFRLA